MFKSAKRDKTEGFVDRIAGRVLELVAAVTGRKSTKAKGKAARGRGYVRTKRGQAKRAAR
jgi:uncharacterized protein YjbJ (UPF0337 family)